MEHQHKDSREEKALKIRRNIKILIGVLILLIIFLIYRYGGAETQLSTVTHNLSTIETQLASLNSKYTTTSHNLSATQANYSIAEQILATPYTKTLYNQQTVQLAPSSTTANLGNIYHFSFNAKYNGYIQLNGTVSLPKATTWSIYATSYPITPQTNSNFYSSGLPVTIIGLNTTQFSVRIPVLNGTNYIYIIDNNYTVGMTLTFSAQYVGFYT